MIYWDNQDPTNEGWAYRVDGPNGSIDSGAYTGLPNRPEYGQLEDAGIHVAATCGITLQRGQIAVEPINDGGWAEWRE